MVSEWKELSIGDVCTIRRGASPRPIKNFISDSGIPWVKIADATASDSRYITSTKEFIIEEGRTKSVEVEIGDLILSNSATPGIPKIMKINACIHDGWLLLRNFKGVIKEYLYYLLLKEKDNILGYANGTVFQNLKTNILRDYKIKIPPLSEQQKIISILSAFDDKIELNNEMNKTLEEIAQAIFKHWFIDFEFPNENGEPYKSSGGEFVDSELGPIPKGWKVGTLKEICHINMGQSPPSSTYNTEGVGIAFYQGVKDFGFRYPSCTIYCSEPKKIAEMGDILLSVRAPVGEVNIAIEKCCIGRGLCSLRMKEGSNNYLYYLLLNQKKNWTKFESGSVFTAINKASIENLPIICPPNYIYREFNELVQPVDEKILNNTKMNIFLSQLRDTLLPKLISGEIRVV